MESIYISFLHGYIVSLNTEQPYVKLEGRANWGIYRNPIDVLFPKVSSAEALRPGYRR